MSDIDLLSQDEIDALMHGADDTADDHGPEDLDGENAIKEYDFSNNERIVRGRMPTLEMVNERFSRYFRVSLFNFLRRSAEISVASIKIQKFSEYVQGLYVPTNLNIIRFHPLRGSALIVMEPRLVFTAVDNFFGGMGSYYNKVEGREFTPTEMRIIRMILDMIFNDLKEAWKPVIPLEFEYVNSEVNPSFASIVSPAEMVIVSDINVVLEGGSGKISIAIPYAMVEPIKDLLDAGLSSDQEDDGARWQGSVRNEVMNAEVDLTSILVEKEITLKEVIDFNDGDIIPIAIPEEVIISSENVPIFKGEVGISDGNYAIKINSKIVSDEDDNNSVFNTG